MAPTYHAVAVDVDERLARRAAAFLAKSGEPPRRLVRDLLERMSRVRLCRESLGLNHWEAYATAYLQRLVQRHESLRRRAAAAFFRTERRAAVARAERMLGSQEEAEDAAGEAFISLFAGKTHIPLFYRFLRQVCLNRLKGRRSAAKVIAPESESGGDESPASLIGRPDWDPECGDPLEILIHREEIQAGIGEILTNGERRNTRRLGWWNELLSHHRPELVGGKHPARLHR